MRKRLAGRVLGSFLFVLWIALGTLHSSALAADSSAISLKNVTLDQTAPKVGDSINLSMEVTATSGQISFVQVRYRATDYDAKIENVYSLQKDPTNPNLWKVSIPVTEAIAKGHWKISEIRLGDSYSVYYFYNKELSTEGNTLDVKGGDFYVDPTPYLPSLASITIDKKQGMIGDEFTLYGTVNEVGTKRSSMKIFFALLPPSS